MPSPKSGKAGMAIAPAAPAEASEADDADPGVVEEIKAQQRQSKKGKYGAVQTKPFKPPKTVEERKERKNWIEIELRDEEGEPVPGARYQVTLSDGGTVAEGTLDEKGFVRIEGIDPGNVKVTFPDLDQDALES
jgi:hypothetical protein